MCCVVYCMCACHSWSCPSCIANTVLWMPRPMLTPAAMSMTPAWPQVGCPRPPWWKRRKNRLHHCGTSMAPCSTACRCSLPCEAKQRSRMEGRSGKRVGVARWRARENAAVCRREREDKTRRALVENLCVTAKLPSSLHEQTRGCRSGVGPRTTLRAAHQPGVGCRTPQGWKATPLPWWPPTYMLKERSDFTLPASAFERLHIRQTSTFQMN